MSQITIEAAAECLAELVSRIPLGDEIILTQNDKPVAKIVPLASTSKPQVKRGFAKGHILYMAPDFDDTPEGFEDYLA